MCIFVNTLDVLFDMTWQEGWLSGSGIVVVGDLAVSGPPTRLQQKRKLHGLELKAPNMSSQSLGSLQDENHMTRSVYGRPSRLVADSLTL